MALSRYTFFFSLLLGVEARAQSSPGLKDKHSSSCGFVCLFLCQFYHQPIEQNSSRGVALPTVSLLWWLSVLPINLTFFLATATLWVFIPTTITSSWCFEGTLVLATISTSVECFVADIRSRHSVCRRRWLLAELKISSYLCVFVWCVRCWIRCQPGQLFVVLLCALRWPVARHRNPNKDFCSVKFIDVTKWQQQEEVVVVDDGLQKLGERSRKGGEKKTPHLRDFPSIVSILGR